MRVSPADKYTQSRHVHDDTRLRTDRLRGSGQTGPYKHVYVSACMHACVHAHTCVRRVYKKESSYIVQHPVLRAAQSCTHFTTQTDLFN